jgi:hypothetical protein
MKKFQRVGLARSEAALDKHPSRQKLRLREQTVESTLDKRLSATKRSDRMGVWDPAPQSFNDSACFCHRSSIIK